MWLVLYNIILHLIILLALPFLFVACLCSSSLRNRIRDRISLMEDKVDPDKKGLWFHASSVGEVLSLRELFLNLLKKDPSLKIFLSTCTWGGKKVAEDKFEDRVKVFLFPLDLPWMLRRQFKRINPQCLIIVETEVWPNLISMAHRTNIPLILLNGRISAGSYPRYRLVRRFLSGLFSCFKVMAIRSEEDKKRIVALGAPLERVRVMGNLKADVPPSQVGDDLKGILIDRLKGKRVFLAGSTHRGEEGIILDVYLELVKEFPELVLFLIPRHIERVGEVEGLTHKNLLHCLRRSRIFKWSDQKVIVWDILGELPGLYRFGDVNFVGGSMVPRGGHNILEAAFHQKAVLFGRFMDNFLNEARLLREMKLGYMVNNRDELLGLARDILNRPDHYSRLGVNAYNLLKEGGAVKMGIDIIKECI